MELPQVVLAIQEVWETLNEVMSISGSMSHEGREGLRDAVLTRGWSVMSGEDQEGFARKFFKMLKPCTVADQKVRWVGTGMWGRIGN